MRKVRISVGPEGCFPDFDGTFVSIDDVKALENRASRVEVENRKLKDQLMFGAMVPPLDTISRSEHRRIIADLERTVGALRKDLTGLQNTCDVKNARIKVLEGQLNEINKIVCPF